MATDSKYMDFGSNAPMPWIESNRPTGRKLPRSQRRAWYPRGSMIDPRVVDAVVRAVLAQLRVDDAPCACHSAPSGCCPDRMGRMVHEGASRFGLQAGSHYPREIARLID